MRVRGSKRRPRRRGSSFLPAGCRQARRSLPLMQRGGRKAGQAGVLLEAEVRTCLRCPFLPSKECPGHAFVGMVAGEELPVLEGHVEACCMEAKCSGRWQGHRQCEFLLPQGWRLVLFSCRLRGGRYSGLGAGGRSPSPLLFEKGKGKKIQTVLSL